MSATEILDRIEQLPPEEQHAVAEKVWEKYGGFDELTPEQVAELDRRAADALAHPENCRPLEDVIADIEKRYRAKRLDSVSSSKRKRNRNLSKPLTFTMSECRDSVKNLPTKSTTFSRKFAKTLNVFDLKRN